MVVMINLLAATDWSFIIPLIGVLIGPVLAYILAAKKLSGKIKTSDAASLWEESGNLRREYKAEMEELRTIVTRLRDRVEDLESKNEALYLENGDLKREVARLHDENRALKVRITELEALNDKYERS